MNPSLYLNRFARRLNQRQLYPISKNNTHFVVTKWRGCAFSFHPHDHLSSSAIHYLTHEIRTTLYKKLTTGLHQDPCKHRYPTVGCLQGCSHDWPFEHGPTTRHSRIYNWEDGTAIFGWVWKWFILVANK
jgi:hypothetical protein